jgi:predicted acylesterase/phospholipase RssA
VPGVFKPVTISGRDYVDGGLTSPVPVQAARDMGADILIVVDVGSGLFKREDIKGVVDVVGQLTNILSERNVELQLATLKPQDILIAVSGDPLRSNCYVMPHNGMLGYTTTKPVRLPPDWEDRLARAG